MNEPQVYIVIHDDHRIEAFETQDAAINAGRDDENVWIETVTITSPTRPQDTRNPYTAAIPITQERQ